jgi:phosphatidylglycerophosphate synthase|tara:strand:- start:622 stop:1203 length:582 start_codon:yes stop_codon:yes gene_type:complete
MRKLPEDLEGPVDNIVYKLVEYITPTLHKLGFTPNILTSFGNISTIIFAYLMFNNKFKLAAIFFLFAYIFDCLDGYMARSFNMVTKYGDWYDHISDLLRIIIYFYVLIKINKRMGIMALILLSIFIFLSSVYLCHQEIYYNKPNDSNSLNMLNTLNFGANKYNIVHYLNKTKYFGCGTTYLLMVLIVFFYKKT